MADFHCAQVKLVLTLKTVKEKLVREKLEVGGENLTTVNLEVRFKSFVTYHIQNDDLTDKDVSRRGYAPTCENSETSCCISVSIFCQNWCTPNWYVMVFHNPDKRETYHSKCASGDVYN